MKFIHTLAAAAMLAAVSLPSFADQPHMEAALQYLEQARAQLQQASNDKGGNRADAIRAVDKAINEVRRGIEYDRTHQKPGEQFRR
ncbi:hypothetical protein AACH06_21170 [Ideonella sp. DXS29W]|uniref:DUF4148 domain-containing protein n=1 Tax=Ideonella lacteola TaxID=2984193 RepID=A0ABU9BTP2_9BURK